MAKSWAVRAKLATGGWARPDDKRSMRAPVEGGIGQRSTLDSLVLELLVTGLMKILILVVWR